MMRGSTGSVRVSTRPCVATYTKGGGVGVEVHECVSFLLISEGKLLVEKRKLSKKTDPGCVAIPGGHVEQGESVAQALVREMDEELSVVPINSDFLCTLYHPTNELQLIHYFFVSSWSGGIENHEAEALLWVAVDDPVMLDIDADKIAVHELVRVFESAVK